MLLENPEGWVVESIRFHRPIMVTLQLAISDQSMPLIGAYLKKSTLDYLPELEKLLNRVPNRELVILGGDHNGNIVFPQQVVDLLASFRMVDILTRF